MRTSKTGRTAYYRGRTLRQQGISGNHFDIRSGEECWIFGVKKDDRHWAGSGPVEIDPVVLDVASAGSTLRGHAATSIELVTELPISPEPAFDLSLDVDVHTKSMAASR